MENKIDVKKIAEQNDKFRKTFQGVSALPLMQQQEIMQKVRAFNNFTEDNDPYGEHDFGCFEYRGQQIFWKIDMYDLNYEFYSPQPDDETQTNRVLTIMFADEYWWKLLTKDIFRGTVRFILHWTRYRLLA